MQFSYRVAGYAAAMLVAVLGTPSLAWEFNTPPVISPELSIPALPLEGLHSSLQLNGAPAAAPESPAVPAPANPVPTALAPAAPEAPARRTLADLVGLHADARTDDAEHECLANAVYFESKGEPLQGQLGVAEVVVNRARSGRFPGSLCGVVKQRGQFSFVRGGRLPTVPRASAAWKKAVAIARVAIKDLADSPAERALFWHYPHYGNQGGAPGAAIRRGDWKLVEWFEDRRVQLFNVAADLSEEHDLARTDPARADRLRAELHAWQKDVGARFPTPNSRYDPAGPNGRFSARPRAAPGAR